MTGRGIGPLLVVLTSLSAIAVGGGCTTYGVRMIVRPEISGFGEQEAGRKLSEGTVQSVLEILQRLADEYAMQRVELPADAKYAEMDGYTPIAMFRRGGAVGRVYLSSGVAVDRSGIVFTIMDFSHGGETEFTRSVRRALENEIAKQLPGHVVVIEDRPAPISPLAP